MKSDQQAKMAQRTPDERNEVAAHTYMRSDLETRCLYLRYLTGEANGRKFARRKVRQVSRMNRVYLG